MNLSAGSVHRNRDADVESRHVDGLGSRGGVG